MSANGTCRFTYTKKTNICTLTVNLSHGSWQDEWAGYGCVNAAITKPGNAVTVPVTLLIGNQVFMAEKPLHYTAIVNKSGLAK